MQTTLKLFLLKVDYINTRPHRGPGYSQNAWSVPPKKMINAFINPEPFQISKSQLNIVIIQP